MISTEALWRTIVLLALVTACTATPSNAQTTLLPTIGLQTMWFNGDYPVRQPISPGVARDLPLGGGVIGNSNGIHIEADVVPDPESRFYFPVVGEAFFLNGKTTFAASRISDKETKRWTFTHSAQIYSAGLGVGTSFFSGPTLYIQAEGRVNIIPQTDLQSRIYLLETDETLTETFIHPDTTTRVRYGAYVKIGTKVPFYDPFQIDFSVGYGVLNLAGKESDPAQQHNLLVVDNRPTPEVTVGYLGLGLTVIYKF